MVLAFFFYFSLYVWISASNRLQNTKWRFLWNGSNNCYQISINQGYLIPKYIRIADNSGKVKVSALGLQTPSIEFVEKALLVTRILFLFGIQEPRIVCATTVVSVSKANQSRVSCMIKQHAMRTKGTSALGAGKWSASLPHVCISCKDYSIPIGQDIGCAQGQLSMIFRSENSLPYRDSNSDAYVIQPLASRCTDWAAAALRIS
jgi:hypothetical protein